MGSHKVHAKGPNDSSLYVRRMESSVVQFWRCSTLLVRKKECAYLDDGGGRGVRRPQYKFDKMKLKAFRRKLKASAGDPELSSDQSALLLNPCCFAHSRNAHAWQKVSRVGNRVPFAA